MGSLRAEFLRKMTELRNSGFTHSIIYLDETWINQNHSHSKCWIDTKSNKATGIHTPTGKGGRLIILHAGSKDGFIKNAELIFQAKNDGDYHHQMNHVVFEKWFRFQLLPNINPSSIIVMDNAPYHSVKIDKPPTAANNKNFIKEWFIRKGANPQDHL